MIIDIPDDTSLLGMTEMYVRLVYARTGMNKTKTAEILKIDRNTLYRYLVGSNMHPETKTIKAHVRRGQRR